MKIAVLIPVYNAERYLGECLDSVLAARQRLESAEGVAHTLDIFCCDDGSTDASRAVLMEYAIRHERLNVTTQTNRGVVLTRNRLLDDLPPAYEAVGFVDSDDRVAPDMYRALLDALEHEQADVAECGMPGNTLAEGRVVEDLSVYLLRATAPGAWINVVNKLYRRSAVGAIRFREGLRFEEDFFFNYEVHAAIRRKVILPQVFYTYRDNPDSATQALDLPRYFASTTRRIRLSLETFLKPGRIPRAIERAWRAELSKDAFRMCLRKNLKKNREDASRRALFREAGGFFAALEREYGFVLTGLNPVQRLILACCRKDRYGLARMLTALT